MLYCSGTCRHGHRCRRARRCVVVQGFHCVVNHGVPEERLAAAFEASRKLHEEVPEAVKAQCAMGVSCPRRDVMVVVGRAAPCVVAAVGEWALSRTMPASMLV